MAYLSKLHHLRRHLLHQYDPSARPSRPLLLVRSHHDSRGNTAMQVPALQANSSVSVPVVGDPSTLTKLPPVKWHPEVKSKHKRPAGWVAPGPRPAGQQNDPSLIPGHDEDLSFLTGDWRIFQLKQGHR